MRPRRTATRCAAAAFCGALASAATAAASPLDDAAANGDAAAAYQYALDADRAGDIDDALRGYELALEIDPSARFGRHALSRARVLRAQLGSGANPQIAREIARITAEAPNDPATATAQMAALLDTPDLAPSDRGRVLFWIAGDARNRGDHRAAWDSYQQLVELDGAPTALQHAAIDGLVGTSGDAGRIAEARSLVATYIAAQGLGPTELGNALDQLSDQLWRSRCDALASVALPAFAAAWLARRAWRGLALAHLARVRAWRGVAFIAWAFGFAAVVSETWYEGNLNALLLCIPVVTAMHVLTLAMGANPPQSRPLGAALGLLAAAATFSAIYLTMRLTERTAMLGM